MRRPQSALANQPAELAPEEYSSLTLIVNLIIKPSLLWLSFFSVIFFRVVRFLKLQRRVELSRSDRYHLVGFVVCPGPGTWWRISLMALIDSGRFGRSETRPLYGFRLLRCGLAENCKLLKLMNSFLSKTRSKLLLTFFLICVSRL